MEPVENPFGTLTTRCRGAASSTSDAGGKAGRSARDSRAGARAARFSPVLHEFSTAYGEEIVEISPFTFSENDGS